MSIGNLTHRLSTATDRRVHHTPWLLHDRERRPIDWIKLAASAVLNVHAARIVPHIAQLVALLQLISAVVFFVLRV